MAAPPSIPIACECGALRGRLEGAEPSAGSRVVCHCKSCRRAAARLGHAERLGADGGVDIFQTSQGRIVIDEGAEQLACGKMTAKGPLRWYARCCNAPIASTLDKPWFPMAGLLTGALKPRPGQSLDDALGPVRFRVFGKFAKDGPVAPGAGEAGIAGLVLRLLPMMIRARRRGDHRNTPFFGADGRPLVRPEPFPDFSESSKTDHPA